MPLGTVKIQGADSSADNTSAGNWLPAVQFTTQGTFLCKVVVFVPTAIAANRVIWIFNAQSGTGATVNPVAVLVCPPGVTTTLDFGNYGKYLNSGLYVAVSTTEPANASSTVTAGANNDAKINVDYRLKP